MHANAIGITSAMRLPASAPLLSDSMNISTMPATAAAIVSQTRPGTRSCRNNPPISAAVKGDKLESTSTLATVVSCKATMKQTYINAHSVPTIRPGLPIARMRCHIAPRY